MRALVLLLVASCTPEITPGAYLCGPEGACPEDLACNHKDATCVLPTQLMPFECISTDETEPNNVSADGKTIPLAMCTSSFEGKSCMPEGDDADWLKFSPPTCVGGIEVEARLSFPISFADLGLELWDLDANMAIATDTACKQGGGALGELRTCLDVPVTAGKNYGIKVHPTGAGTCDGTCSFNRYTLMLQLAAPE